MSGAVEPSRPSARRAATGQEGAAGRVAAVHRQTRRGLAFVALFLVAAVIAAAVPHGTGTWLPLHLFLVGGLLGAISTVTPMLAVTWSSSPPPSPRSAAAQRYSLATGTTLLAVGREAEVDGITLAGAVLLAAAVVLLIRILLRVRAEAVTDRFAPAIEGYVVALGTGLAGMAMGAGLVKGVGGRRWVDLRAAHLTVNLYGLIGLVIASTLPFFLATQMRTKMSPRARAGAVRVVVGALAAAVAVATVGRALGHPRVAAAGLAGYAIALVGVLLLLPWPGRKQLTWAGPRLVQLFLGVVWWLAITAAMAVAVWRGKDEGDLVRALVVGGFAPILLASLAYLVPVLRGGGHARLTAGFATTRSWIGLAAGNLAAVAALLDRRRLLYAAILVWLVDSLARGALLQFGLDKRSSSD